MMGTEPSFGTSNGMSADNRSDSDQRDAMTDESVAQYLAALPPTAMPDTVWQQLAQIIDAESAARDVAATTLAQHPVCNLIDKPTSDSTITSLKS